MESEAVRKRKTKPMLPRGWVARYSKTYPDLVYFFNTITGVSSWEQPPTVSEVDSTASTTNHKISKPRYEDKDVEHLFSAHSPPPTLDANASSSVTVKPSKKKAICKDLKKLEKKRRHIINELLENSATSSQVKISNKTAAATNTRRTKIVINRKSLDKNAIHHKKTCKKFKKSLSSEQKKQSSDVEMKSDLSDSKRHSTVVEVKRNAVLQQKKQLPDTSTRKNILEQKRQSSDVEMRSDLSDSKKHSTVVEVKRNAVLQQKKQLPDTSTRKNISEQKRQFSDVEMRSDLSEVKRNAVLQQKKQLPDTSTRKNISEQKRQSSDVEMVDVSKEETQSSSPKLPLREADDATQPYFVVVDTNILIHDLNFVDELKDKPLQGRGPPIIVVPWIVVQELDSIKCSSKFSLGSSELHKQVSDAIRFLNTMLMAQHPRIRGQTCTMASQTISSMVPKCNDDKVLHCCLQLIEVSKIPRERVVLLTNDKNLCNKAIISNIKAHTTDSVLNDFQVDFSPVKNSKPVYSAFANFPSHIQIKMIAEVKAEVDTVVCHMKHLLKESFSKILEMEMKAAYGVLWSKIVHVQPPWSFIDILECFKRHWFPVFSFVFSRDMLSQVEILRTSMRETKGYVHDEEKAAEILTAALTLCKDIETKYKDMSDTIEKLKCLQNNCAKLCKKTKMDPSDIKKDTKPKDVLTSEERQKKILMVFQHTWASLNNICGTVLDSLGHPNIFKYEVPSQLPSETETVEFLEKLYCPLRKLMQSMNNVLRCSLKDEGTFRKSCANLYEVLISFLPGLNLPLPITLDFSIRDMEEFCRNPGKKELLEHGNQQLVNFYSTVHHCLSFFSDVS